jgi:hypothetical protein
MDNWFKPKLGRWYNSSEEDGYILPLSGLLAKPMVLVEKFLFILVFKTTGKAIIDAVWPEDLFSPRDSPGPKPKIMPKTFNIKIKPNRVMYVAIKMIFGNDKGFYK